MAVQTGRHSKERDGAWRESYRRKLVSKELVKVWASCVVVPMHVHNRASCLTGIMYFCCVPHALLSASNSHKWLYKSTLKESFVITVDADLPESTKMNISWSGPKNSKWCTRIEKYFNVWLALDFFFSLLFRAGRIAPWEFFSPFSFFSWIPAESHVILLLCIWVVVVFSYKSRILLYKLLIESFFKFIPTHGLIETCAISILLLPAAMWWTALQILLFLESFVSVLLSWKRGLKCD